MCEPKRYIFSVASLPSVVVSSDRMAVAVSGSTEPVALFNPRQHVWSDHFEWDEYAIAAKTLIGRVTIETLHLNDERRRKIRQAEQLFGLFPPET